MTKTTITALIAFFAAALAGESNAHAFAKAKPKDNRPDAAIAVLSAFQGSCGSQGVFTQSAQAQTNAIINVIETLKSTDACKPFISELTTIQTAASSMQGLQQDASYSTYQTDQQNYQLLTLALQNAGGNATEAQSFETALGTLRTQMFTDQAAYDVDTQTARHNQLVSQSSSMLSWGQSLASTSGSMFSSGSPDLAQCLQQSPAAAVQLATNMVAYGGSFLPGIFGAGVSAIGQLVNTGLEILRESQYDDAIYQAEGTEMPDALECALESMTESYCNADDSFTLLDLARNNRLQDYSATPLWRGIDILGRQLPSLTDWLARIQNEGLPEDPYQAAKENSVFQEIFLVEEENLDAIAAINYALDQAQASTTDAARFSAVESVIANLAIQIVAPSATAPGSTTSGSSPFTEFQPSAFQWECWLVQGSDATCTPPSISETGGSLTGIPSVTQLTQYLNNELGLQPNGVSNMAEITKIEGTLLNNWEAVVPKVNVLVNADFARIIATNAGVILASARDATNGHPLSPFEVLQNISSFFQGMIDFHADNPELPLVLTQEKQKVDEAIRQLTASDADVCPPQRPLVAPAGTTGQPDPIPLTPAQCQAQRLTTISNLFGLQNGTQVFLTDMTGLVHIDLHDRFTAGEIPSDATQLLQASGQDLYVALAAAGSGDLDPIADDLDGARSDIEGNIRVFRQFFVKAFQQVVAQESALAAQESPADGANRPHGQRLGELCMLWLMTGNIPTSASGTLANWPDPDTAKACEATLYFNENDAPVAGQPEQPAFAIAKLEQAIGTQVFQARACEFHRYKLKNKAETLYTIPPTPTPAASLQLW